MCQFKSAMVVKAGEDYRLFYLDDGDSHEEIRKKFDIRDTGPLCKATPVELVPVRGFRGPDDCNFVFDAGKPDWWDESWTDGIKTELYYVAASQLKGDEYKDLDLSRLTSAAGLTLPKTVSGGLDLSRLTSAAGLTLPKTVSGWLNLCGLTSAAGLTLPKTVSGGLDLSGLTSADRQELRARYPKLRIYGRG